MSVPGWVRSTGAVLAGFATTVILSTAVDAVMHGTGVFPSFGQVMSDGLFALAAAYRIVFTVAGAYVTARLAPDRPMIHAWVLAGIGLLAGIAGVVAYYKLGGPAMGPAWYAIQIPLTAIPCVWLGARLAVAQRRSAAA